jgi:transposase
VTISADLEAQILRYYHAEHWKPGTICRQLGVHHDTVQRVLAQHGVPRAARTARASILEPYLPFVHDVLRQYPRLTASRLYAMVRERGYAGHPDHFRHLIAQLRPRQPAEAYLRLRTLPGEQAQVDWGHFGTLTIGRAVHALMAFVMVLSYSRRIFLRFFLGARMENFLRGHDAAFCAWNAVPRVLLYDNLKSAVLERRGDAIRFHPTLLAFAAHGRFEPRPVAIARGNEKGRVERAIRYARDNFWPARTFRDLDDLNAQAQAWCDGPAQDRPCPEDRSQTVRAAFEHERTHLLALPDNPFPIDEVVEVSVGKTPYVRFDRNDYSVPHAYVRRALTVRATLTDVRVLDGATVVASHRRSFDRGEQIEVEAHVAALVASKRAARTHRGLDRLTAAVPRCQELLTHAAARGENLGTLTAGLLRLLDAYGAAELRVAVAEALARGVPHPNAVRLALERRREARGAPPPLAVPLSDAVRRRDPTVRTHALSSYDVLKSAAAAEHTPPEPEEPTS